MKVLFHDEKYISETIEILSQLFDEAKLNGEPQVCDHKSQVTDLAATAVYGIET